MPVIEHIKIDGTTYDIQAGTTNLPDVTYTADVGYAVDTAVRILDGNTFLAEGPVDLSGVFQISGDTGIVISNCSAFTCNCQISAQSFNANSDLRLKENIEDTKLDYNYLLDNLHIVDFNFKADKDKKLNVGLIAQELQEALPENYRAAIVSENPVTGYLSINEAKLVYISLLALKEQKQKIADLEARIWALENK